MNGSPGKTTLVIFLSSQQVVQAVPLARPLLAMVWVSPGTFLGFLEIRLCLTLDRHETTLPYPMLRDGGHGATVNGAIIGI